MRQLLFGKGGNTTLQICSFSYLLVLHKYQMIYRISIILYRYKYRIEKIDQYPALVCVCALDSFVFKQQVLFRVDFLSVAFDHRVQCPRVGLGVKI